MRNLSKVLICSTILLLPKFSFADSRGDMAANFLAGFLEAAQKAETQNDLKKRTQTQTATALANGASRYTMNTKEEFFRGVKDGRVWSLLSDNSEKVCFSGYKCYPNIYTQDTQERLNPLPQYVFTDGSPLINNLYQVLRSSYGLQVKDLPEYKGILNTEVESQLTAIALLNSTTYENDESLKKIFDESTDAIFNATGSFRFNNNFLRAYRDFLNDYNKVWGSFAPVAVRNSYFLKQTAKENNIEECKKSSTYKLYHAAQNAKDMEQAVKLNDMALQMASPYDPDTARIRGERNMAAGMRTYFLNEYKKLGGKATSVASINVPANPCK